MLNRVSKKGPQIKSNPEMMLSSSQEKCSRFMLCCILLWHDLSVDTLYT